MKKNCELPDCGKPFEPARKDAKYCSAVCRKQATRLKVKKRTSKEAVVGKAKPVKKARIPIMSLPKMPIESLPSIPGTVVSDNSCTIPINTFRARLPGEGALDYAFAKNEWKKKQPTI